MEQDWRDEKRKDTKVCDKLPVREIKLIKKSRNLRWVARVKDGKLRLLNEVKYNSNPINKFQLCVGVEILLSVEILQRKKFHRINSKVINPINYLT